MAGLQGLIAGKQRVQFIQNNSTVIQLDVSVREKHSRASPLSKFPTEEGNPVSDNVFVRPFSLEITGIITDTPIGNVQALITQAATTLATLVPASVPPVGIAAVAAGTALFSAIAGSKSPSVVAYAQLLALQESAMPFDVLTSLYRYSSMVITDLSAPREADTGQVLIFTVQLEQAIIVAPQSVNIQIFANPALSANIADVGQQESSISGFQNGLNAATAQTTSATNAFNSLAGG